MRNLALTMLAVGLVSAAEPAQAQKYDPNYPVCLSDRTGDVGYTDCSFTSLSQCNASASGRAAICQLNPFFANGPADRPGPRSRAYPAY